MTGDGKRGFALLTIALMIIFVGPLALLWLGYVIMSLGKDILDGIRHRGRRIA